MNIYKKRKCIICEREFNYKTNPTHNRSKISTRSCCAVTCSKKCSRMYTRISIYIRNRLIREIKK